MAHRLFSFSVRDHDSGSIHAWVAARDLEHAKSVLSDLGLHAVGREGTDVTDELLSKDNAAQSLKELLAAGRDGIVGKQARSFSIRDVADALKSGRGPEGRGENRWVILQSPPRLRRGDVRRLARKKGSKTKLAFDSNTLRSQGLPIWRLPRRQVAGLVEVSV